MKKAINKAERAHIITSLAIHAAGRKAQEIFDSLAALRKEIAAVLLSNWEDQFPGIPEKDQLALLQSGGANRLTFKPGVYAKGATEGTTKNVGEFGRLAWENSNADGLKSRISSFASKIFTNATGTTGVVSEGVTSGYASSLYLNATYTGIIHGGQPETLYDASADLPGDLCPVLNDQLVTLHIKVTGQLRELKSLIYATEDAYQALSVALAPVKNAQELAELMPEAVKFFPASLTYVKPTKEIADPAAINDIRAKLRKGLPI